MVFEDLVPTFETADQVIKSRCSIGIFMDNFPRFFRFFLYILQTSYNKNVVHCYLKFMLIREIKNSRCRIKKFLMMAHAIVSHSFLHLLFHFIVFLKFRSKNSHKRDPMIAFLEPDAMPGME